MASKLELLTLKTIYRLGDGDLEKDFEATMQGLVKDCLARPSIKKTREVKLVVRMNPVLKEDGSCDDVDVDIQVASKQPAKTIPTYRMRTTVNGGLKYQPASPMDPDQTGLDFDK